MQSIDMELSVKGEGVIPPAPPIDKEKGQSSWDKSSFIVPLEKKQSSSNHSTKDIHRKIRRLIYHTLP